MEFAHEHRAVNRRSWRLLRVFSWVICQGESVMVALGVLRESIVSETVNTNILPSGYIFLVTTIYLPV